MFQQEPAILCHSLPPTTRGLPGVTEGGPSGGPPLATILTAAGICQSTPSSLCACVSVFCFPFSPVSIPLLFLSFSVSPCPFVPQCSLSPTLVPSSTSLCHLLHISAFWTLLRRPCLLKSLSLSRPSAGLCRSLSASPSEGPPSLLILPPRPGFFHFLSAPPSSPVLVSRGPLGLPACFPWLVPRPLL